MKLSMYIMASEPISKVYFINPSHKPMCLYVYPRLLLGNGSVKMLQRQWIHIQQQKNYWTRPFLCSPCHIDGKYAISSSQNFLFAYSNYI
jgi:hypothetical protein